MPTAEDCAINCWCDALAALNAHRERNGQWRADCPVPGCGAERSLEYDAPGRHVRWKSFCGDHDKDAIRPYLAKLIGPCMPSGLRRERIEHEELIVLALSGLPPLALKTQMLVYAGLSTTEALDRLRVDRTTRYRIRQQLSQFGDKTAGDSTGEYLDRFCYRHPRRARRKGRAPRGHHDACQIR
jgi:hypothetical protein